MSLVGAPLSAKVMLTTSVDLELALQQALAVRTGGQEVKGSHSRVGPFSLPVGGIVLCVMPVPLGFVRLSWTCPRLAFLPLRSDLLQVFFALQYWVCSNIGVSVIGDCKECI